MCPMAAAPERLSSPQTPRPLQSGLRTYSTHAGRARRIQRTYEAEELVPGHKRPSLLAALAVDAALCAHARTKGRAWPYVSTLAAETHQSARTVRYATQWLEANGFLAKRQTGRYTVYFPLFLTVAGAEQKGTPCLPKEGGLSVSFGDKQTDPSTAEPLTQSPTTDPKHTAPTGECLADPRKASESSEPPAPEQALPRTATPRPTAALLQAVALTSSRGLAAALRCGVSVRLERGVCVLVPRHQWQAEILTPLVRPSDDPRHLELMQAAELAFGVDTRLRVAASGGSADPTSCQRCVPVGARRGR